MNANPKINPERPGTLFELDGQQVQAHPGETIWAVAKRLGTHIPHLCHKPQPGYRPDGNCRACMVEIEGERVLAASCKRTPRIGRKVKTATERARLVYRVKVTVENSKGTLKPGMPVDVELGTAGAS